MNFGYMTEDDHGWLLEVLKVSEFENGYVAGFQGSLPATTQLTSGELMKTWRHKPLHDGSVVESMLGFRYTVLKNSYEQFTQVAAIPFEVFTFERVAIENNIYGPQVGLRWYKQKGRWTISSEGRYYYAFNDQHYEPREFTSTGVKEERWVHAGDIRAEVTYDITKSFALSLGAQFLYFGNGIARGDAIGNNDQDAYFVAENGKAVDIAHTVSSGTPGSTSRRWLLTNRTGERGKHRK